MFAADPTLDVVASVMLESLNGYVQPSLDGLPEASVSIASMAERAVGIGRHLGSGTIGSFPVSIKGIRLDAVARFQLWGPDPAAADGIIAELNSRLMAASETLRAAGFQRLSLESTPPAQPFSDTVGGWRRYADYRILYEFNYQSTDSAQSFIVRIPVGIDGGLENESMTVTGTMTRWDDTRAPILVVRGPTNIGSLSLLAFLPGGPPTGPLALTRTYDSATGSPPPYATLDKFLAAVAGPNAPHRQARFTFPSFKQFRAAFKGGGQPISLGDWNLDGAADQYTSAVLAIDPPIGLPTIRDRFEIAYDGGRKFNRTGVAYLRVS